MTDQNGNFIESAITFNVNENQLLGILHLPQNCLKVAVLVVVGGPQYRVGSHRQFVQLSRSLSNHNIASLRFDYSGMGDSDGDKKSFDNLCLDIERAVDELCSQEGIENVILWGLCDAASASMIYGYKDARIKGLFLLNPWLHSEAAMGATMLKYYYVQRLFSRAFWQKLLRGNVKIAASIHDAKSFAANSMSQASTEIDSFQHRMRTNLDRFKGEICVVLSGADLTAREFEQQSLGKKHWPVLASSRCQIHRLFAADHTFSNELHKHEVENLTAIFVKSLIDN